MSDNQKTQAEVTKVASATEKTQQPALEAANTNVKATAEVARTATATAAKLAKKADLKPVAPEAKAVKAVRKTAKTTASKAKAKAQPKTRIKAQAPRQGVTQMTNTQAKTVKNTIDTVTAAGNEAFKEGFEKTLKTVNDVNAFTKENADAVIASATAAGKGVETINANVVAFAKKSMEDTVAATKALSTAKSVQEMIEVQSDFVKSSMDAYLAEINRTTDLYANAFKASLKPLNDRFAATVEMVQSQR